VVESPAPSTTDVMSAAVGAGATTVSEAERVGTSMPPTAGAEGGELGASGPQAAPGPQGIIEEGMKSVDNEDRCRYVGTLWEAEVVTNRRDLETFKEAAHTIGIVLLVRTCVDFLRSCFGFLGVVGFNCSFCLLCSPLLSGPKLGQAYCARRRMRTPRLPQPMRRTCRPRSQLHKRSSMSKRSWRARRRRRWSS
jgi:hypothetical protein